MRIQFTHLARLILLLLMSGGLVGIAQTSWVPGHYYGIPHKDKHVSFFDEFDDNRYEWDLGSPFLYEEIKSGEFRCATLRQFAYTKRRAVAMETTGNYEVEVSIRFVKGREDQPLGLTFGRNVRGSEFRFLFNSQQQYKIVRYDRGRQISLKNWTFAGSLSKFAFNILTIRRVGHDWFFFINKQLVAQIPAQPLFGNEYGFTVGGSMVVEVDYLSISEIRSVDSEGPVISMIYPEVNERTLKHFSDRKQILKGKVNDPAGVESVMINGESVTLYGDGMFAASLTLPDGVHPIEIVAKDVFGNTSRLHFSMMYKEPAAPLAIAPSNSYVPMANAPTGHAPAYAAEGKNYLLMIGIDRYAYWNRLNNAVKDCKDIAETLINYYEFERENVFYLLNDQATRENILEMFEHLQETIRSQDNLVIYYAGHGYYDTFSELGYWVPYEARLNKIPDFIRNSTIHDYLRTIDSHHTLLVADACYAGSLFATYRGAHDLDARSRWAFTSGNIEKVWDGQPGQNSPFARYLIRELRNSPNNELRADELIRRVSTLVERNTAQNPQGNPLRHAGDDGGIFVFRRR